MLGNEGLNELFGNTQLKSSDVGPNATRATNPLHFSVISLRFPSGGYQTIGFYASENNQQASSAQTLPKSFQNSTALGKAIAGRIPPATCALSNSFKITGTYEKRHKK